MFKKISGLLRKNLGLKLLSIFIAVVIWYIVVGVNDPVITRSYSVKVATENETYIQNGKQLFRIEDEYKTVTVYVKANRSTLRDIDAGNIVVTADLTQIVDLDATPVMVPLSVSRPGVDRANITLARTAIPITIEEIASKEYSVVIDTGDSKPSSNYEVGVLTANPEKVTLTGPKSVIGRIETVVAEIDVTGMTYNATKKGSLHLYDKDQQEITESTVEDDISFDVGSADVTVAVELWKRVTDIRIGVEYTGVPMDGYQTGIISTTPETVSVVGSEEALSELKENNNTITIPADYIDISGASEDVSMEVDLQELMPDNMRIASNTASVIGVVVPILPQDSREIQVDVDDIATKSLGENLTVSYDQTEVAILIRGEQDLLSKVKAADLKPTIDCSGLTEGDYSLDVSFTIPAELELVGKVTIPVHIKQAAKAG